MIKIMKARHYILMALCAALAAISCQKHAIITYIDNEGTEGKALFQIIDIIPVNANAAANAIDSVFVNGKIVSRPAGAGQLKPKGILPYGNTFYTVNAGNVQIQFYKADQVIYDQTVSLPAGMSEVYVYNLEQAPVILDHQGVFQVHSEKGSAATYQMDSVASFRLVHFLFQADGVTPYGKLQYQYSNNSGSSYTAGDWHNLGEPVSWGESTTRNLAVVHKTVNNSSGSQTLRFRCVDENGNYISGSGDYWTTYLGRANTHVANGRAGGSPGWNYAQFINNY